jgi:hypothetical protein
MKGIGHTNGLSMKDQVCKFCSYNPGDAGNIITGADSTCIQCGQTFPINAFMVYKGVYHFETKTIHRFFILDRIECPKCGIDISNFDVPCEHYIRDIHFEKAWSYFKERLS